MNQHIKINEPHESQPTTGATSAFLSLGFRPFFLAAGIFAVVTMFAWALIYQFQLTIPLASISSMHWHAHEMIYGYSIAVIAGFLLTAVKNWTGILSVSGKPLLFLFLLWLSSRGFFLIGDALLWLAAITDLLFSILLVYFVAAPVIKVKQWKQMAIVSKLVLLLLANVFFYAGALFGLELGVYWGVYGGLYLIIGLVLTMGRRVVPFFIESGVGYAFQAKNSRWIDITSLILFLGFFISELFFQNQMITAYLASGLFVLHAIRLCGWHTPGIWKKPLLWSLYLSFWFITLGFLLFSAVHFFGISKSLAIHAFAVGGIGVITLAMMSRVALGHSGRSVSDPPKILFYAFACLILAAVFRVVLPLIDASHYTLWIGVSQILWMISFAIFSIVYFPVLTRPSQDGRPT